MSKIVIITGASDGIGRAAARILKEKGMRVVLVGRSPEKTKAAAAELSSPYFVADFAKLDDVRKLARDIKKAYPRIDVLVNNAGGVFSDRQLTVDGFEKTMQVNHLAHFLLTSLLMDILIKSKAAIINTSSDASKLFAKFDINDINMQHAYSQNSAYANAKLENILFTKELDRRYSEKGIKTAAFHPGIVASNFAHDSSSVMRFMSRAPFKYLLRVISPEKGADTLVWLATTNGWKSGEYYTKRKIAKPNDIANDPDIAWSLWEQSEMMIRST